MEDSWFGRVSVMVGFSMMNQCECGCGATIASDKRFVRGHAARMPNHPFYGGGMQGRKYSAAHKANMSIAQRKRTKFATGTTIDWPWYVAEYNKNYDTDFKNEKELYLGLYPILSPSQIGRRLLISWDTILRRLDYYCIERCHKQGGPNNTACPKYNAFLAIPENTMKDMTAKMLAGSLKIHIQTVRSWLRLTGRSCLRLRGL